MAASQPMSLSDRSVTYLWYNMDSGEIYVKMTKMVEDTQHDVVANLYRVLSAKVFNDLYSESLKRFSFMICLRPGRLIPIYSKT